MQRGEHYLGNLLLLCLSLILYPILFFSWFLPNNLLYKYDLQGLPFLGMGIAWLVAIALVINYIARVKLNKKNIIFWLGFSFNIMVFLIPFFVIALSIFAGYAGL